MNDRVSERFFEILISGNRAQARKLIEEQRTIGTSSERLIEELFWPTYEMVDNLYRRDQLAKLPHHTAIKLLRSLVDQNSPYLTASPSNGRTIMAFCGQAESEELGAQMAVDLLEAHGFSVTFAGGGIANDEILAQVNEQRPDVLLMFASAPTDLPNIRTLIDTIREIDGAPDVQIAVGAGVFNRAEGLAEEIGADVWASTPLDMAQTLISEPTRRAGADQRSVGKKIKRRAVA
jgi:MerR family transcriptional regulator, light-induced transcriptional regulator